MLCLPLLAVFRRYSPHLGSYGLAVGGGDDHRCSVSHSRGFLCQLTIASCFESVQMMMFAALHDIRVRGYRRHGTILSTVLPNIAALMPLEAAMDKAGKRLMQTFPPYSMAFDANIAALLSEVATQVKAVERNGRQLDPFHDFKEHRRSSQRISAKWRSASPLRAVYCKTGLSMPFFNVLRYILD